MENKKNATLNAMNDYGTAMCENRPSMSQLDKDELGMSAAEWKKYIAICDSIAINAFAYVSGSKSDENGLNDFRSALHALFTFVGTDTRILSLDSYTLRFIPAVISYKTVKSDAYKKAEKDMRAFRKGLAWALVVNKLDEECNTDTVLFDGIENLDTMREKYFSAEVQNEYNAIVPFVKNAIESKTPLTVSVLAKHLTHLEDIVTDLGNTPWQCYKDFKNPMKSSTGKALKHCQSATRKGIEDAMADMLMQRQLMTVADREKELAQVKAGRRQSEAQKNA